MSVCDFVMMSLWWPSKQIVWYHINYYFAAFSTDRYYYGLCSVELSSRLPLLEISSRIVRSVMKHPECSTRARGTIASWCVPILKSRVNNLVNYIIFAPSVQTYLDNVPVWCVYVVLDTQIHQKYVTKGLFPVRLSI